VLCHSSILRLYFASPPPTDLPLTHADSLLLLDLLYSSPSLEPLPSLFLRHLPADALLSALSTTLPAALSHPRLHALCRALHSRLTSSLGYYRCLMSRKLVSQDQVSALSQLFRERSKLLMEIFTIHNEVANRQRAGNTGQQTPIIT